MSGQFLISNQQNSDLGTVYTDLINEFATLAQLANVKVVPFHSPNSLYFNLLPEAKKVSTLTHLNSFIKACRNTISSGSALDSAATLTWHAIKEFGYSPQSDLMNKIDSNDIVEIYDHENVQIFRNLNFFRICSYSFDEILCRPWWTLYRRDDEVTRQIFTHAVEMLTCPDAKTKLINIPRHFLEEIESTHLYKMEISLNLLSPLRKDGKVVAAVVTETAQLLN